MKKLCAIILPAILGVILSSCTWVYQVTGMEEIALASETTEQQPPDPRGALQTNDTKAVPTEESAPRLREGRYSNGKYIMELTSIGDQSEEGYYIIIYTPQYGIQMFIGATRESDAWDDTFTVTDNDDSRVTLVVDPSEDGRVLTAQMLVDGEEKTIISGEYTYYDEEYWETEKTLSSAGIIAGDYTNAGYRMKILYSDHCINVEIYSVYGKLLLQTAKQTDEILHSAVFEGEWGNMMLISAGDGSGKVVVSGRDDGDSPLLFAGTYSLST